MKTTILHLTLLIHYHIKDEPTYAPHAPAVIEYTEQLRQYSLIYADPESGSGFKTTEKGARAISLMNKMLDSFLPGITQEVGA